MQDLQIEITVHVESLEKAMQFYCEETGLFELHTDYGMLQRTVAYKANDAIRLY